MYFTPQENERFISSIKDSPTPIMEALEWIIRIIIDGSSHNNKDRKTVEIIEIIEDLILKYGFND